MSTIISKIKSVRHLGVSSWLMLFSLAVLAVGLIFPMTILGRYSVVDANDKFVGIDNFVEYLQNDALVRVIFNTLNIAVITTLLVITLAFVFAYALNRTNMVGKRFFKIIAFLPILAPSLLPAISFVYLFGNQGVLKSWLFGSQIYGPIGIVMSLSFWCFPHALMIINTAFSNSDQRLYEASRTLGAGTFKTLLNVTLQTTKYGLISAAMVVFTLTVADFGAPKVIGGQYSVLATDIYKQVIGQQNFNMGAVVSLIILLPAVVNFGVDRWLNRKQKNMIDHKAVPYKPVKNIKRDIGFFAFCTVVSISILGVIGMAIYASFIKFWPYNLSLGLNNYQFDLMDGGGWGAYYNTLQMSLLTAFFGTIFVFLTTYITEKTNAIKPLKNVVQMVALLPVAIPGLVLGLAYVFFFNHPDNPLNVLYGTMTILVFSCIIHYYTVCHMTATTALKQIDSAIEGVSQSLKVPQWKTALRVTLPMSLPAVLDIGFYYFVNAMSTVSAVVFLYSSDTMLASIAVLNMDDAGDIAPAAAMASLIFITCLAARAIYSLLSYVLLNKTQAWRIR